MGNRFKNAIVRCGLLMLIGLSAPASTSNHPTSLCDRLERNMDRIRAQLRQGGSRAEQARARSRMHRLKSRYYRRCRSADRK